MHWEFRLLGKPEIWHNDQPLSLIENLHTKADKHTLATAAAYRGNFLEGFTTNSPQFEAWKAERQAHYRQMIIGHL